VAWRVLLIIYIMSGFWLWLGGRENYHIGASNIVYGLASFLFLSGIIRKHIGLIAISLLVVFLYGSMVWGLLPVLQKISWEGHLFGTLAGILCAYSFRKEGTQRKRYEWEFEEDDGTPPPQVDETIESPLRVVYTFKESDKSKEDEPGKN
jgi:membrane associated rhomboid family serine protease